MPLTVRKLIKRLSQCEENAIVVVASDEEGNSYSLLNHCSRERLPFEDVTGLDALTYRLLAQADPSIDTSKNELPVVIIWPSI